MASIRFDHVTKRFPNGVVAVQDLNLEIADGEVIVLVGPSGCGKTTLLRLIAGLEEPSSGSVWLGGVNASRLVPRERNVALMFQRPALYPHLTVRANLAFGLEMRDRRSGLTRLWLGIARPAEARRVRAEQSGRRQRIEEIAGILHLDHLLDRLPAELSGGEQQRVALGRCLARNPAVFLLDEPLSNLDAPLRAEMRRQLHLLPARFPATMIHVTHDSVEALSLADRVVVLRHGTPQQADRPLEVYDRPCNRFVAGFIGWPPMSFLDGTLGHKEGRLGIQVGDYFFAWSPERSLTEPADGTAVTLGFRPEALARQLAQPDDVVVRMTQTLLEPLGGCYLATYRRAEMEVTSLLPRTGCPPAEAGEVEVVFNMQHAHLFDRATGLALSGRVARGQRER